MEIEVQSPRSLLPTLLTQLATEKDLEIRLQLINIIVSSLDENVALEIKAEAFKEYIKSNFLNNKEFMRQFRIINNLNCNPELSLEYLGEDYPSHPEFQFRPDVEQKVTQLKTAMDIFCGKLIKSATKGEVVQIA